MALLETLKQRADGRCELCQSDLALSVYTVPPHNDGNNADVCVLMCKTCHEQLGGESSIDSNHWRCLSDAMWNSNAAVQVVAYRQLQALSAESWAQNNLDMLYLDDTILVWAEQGASDNDTPTTDSKGSILQAGDSVTLIKDLPVKGAGFTAKRGTAVRNISLTDNPEHIEGRVTGQRVVLVSKFLKKM